MRRPVRPSFPLTLLSARPEIPGVRTFRFASPPDFSFIPGQFLMLRFEDEPKLGRAYSLCSSPASAPEFFELTVGLLGPFSDRLAGLRPGASSGLTARGPFGRWTYDGSDAHAVLVSGGTGLTPFRAMCLLKKDRRLPGRLTLLCAARVPGLLLYRGEHAGWRDAGVAVKPFITRPDELAAGEPWQDGVGRITAECARRAADDGAAVYYLCGPAKMVQELHDGLLKAGVPAEKVRTEKWGDYSDLFS